MNRRFSGIDYVVGADTPRLDEAALGEPLRWRAADRCFVCSMTDLFWEAIPDEFIDRVFAVMALCPTTVFQVLTKRPERMMKYTTAQYAFNLIGAAAQQIVGRALTGSDIPRWPPPNVWLGVSTENQAAADERIPLLLQTPAAVRFLSVEPLLGPVDLRSFPMAGPRNLPGIDWVIAGGESGPGARPPHPDWFRRLRDQCVAAGVAYFFKQWGEYAEVPLRPEGFGRMMMRAGDVVVARDGRRAPIKPDLSCDLEGAGMPMRRVGKKKAGAVLDGREWRETPR